MFLENQISFAMTGINYMIYLFLIVMIQYYWIYCFDQINAVLVSIRIFLQINSYKSQMLQTVA